MRRMKRFLCLGFAAILLVGCGGATGGGSAAAGNAGSGAGKASIDLTITGDVQGSTTQLLSYNCAGAQFGAFSDTFKPMFNGAQWDLSMLIGKVTTTPATVDLAAEGNRVLLDMHYNGGGWRNNADTTGTITIDAGGDSGTVEAHSMVVLGVPGSRTVDMKLKFTCPYQH